MGIWRQTKAAWKFLMLLEMRRPELRQGCSLSESPNPDWTAVWIACAGPHNVLFSPRRTFPYRTHLLCSHSWSRYQRAVCTSPASLPGKAGRKCEQNLVPKQGTGASKQLAHPFTNAGSWARPGRTGFYPFLCLWVSSRHYLRSLNQDFHRHPLTFWVFLMHKLRLWPQGPVCHLQRSRQHRLQERNNRYSGTQPPRPLLRTGRGKLHQSFLRLPKG